MLVVVVFWINIKQNQLPTVRLQLQVAKEREALRLVLRSTISMKQGQARLLEEEDVVAFMDMILVSWP